MKSWLMVLRWDGPRVGLLTWPAGRLRCRWLGVHNVTCRGRRDHDGSGRYGWPNR